MLDTPKVNSALTGDTEDKIATSIGQEGLAMCLQVICWQWLGLHLIKFHSLLAGASDA